MVYERGQKHRYRCTDKFLPVYRYFLTVLRLIFSGTPVNLAVDR